jgi:hypothetical protein
VCPYGAARAQLVVVSGTCDVEHAWKFGDRAAKDAARLAHTGIGNVVIDTDRLTVSDVADALHRQIGDWPRS